MVDLSRSKITVTSPGAVSLSDVGGLDHIDHSRLTGGVLRTVSSDIVISNSWLDGVTLDCSDGGIGVASSKLTDTTWSSTQVCGVGVTNSQVAGPGSGTFMKLETGSYGATITGNTFTGWDTAVRIDTVDGLTMTGNTFRDNTTPVTTCDGLGCDVDGTISSNRFVDNTGTGLSLITVGQVHVGSNVALRNGGLGIDVAWSGLGTGLTVIDDGGNVARHNQAPQCIGVICASH